jgi:hypothetical protein
MSKLINTTFGVDTNTKNVDEFWLKDSKKVLEYVAPPLRCWWSMPSLFPPYGYSQMSMLVLWSLSKNARSLFEIIYGQARNKMKEQESIGKIVVVNKVKAS